VAFGVAGGPVVVVENHADHVFWAGCSVGDQVLEIRQSGHLWTKQLRGVDRSLILPIPLTEPKAIPLEVIATARLELRQSLGLPEDAVMLLTVGSAAKYEPMPGLNFLEAAQEILRACPNAYLVAVGPKDEGVWRAARQASGGRILPVGYQQDSTLFCRSADLYLEGFPLGSLTALLEAGQAGLMCVRAPLDSPLPFCSDSVSLDSIPQPRDLSDYVRTATALINDSARRIAGGKRLQQDINAQHCGAGKCPRPIRCGANSVRPPLKIGCETGFCATVFAMRRLRRGLTSPRGYSLKLGSGWIPNRALTPNFGANCKRWRRGNRPTLQLRRRPEACPNVSNYGASTGGLRVAAAGIGS
jgi:hypothetical protein